MQGWFLDPCSYDCKTRFQAVPRASKDPHDVPPHAPILFENFLIAIWAPNLFNPFAPKPQTAIGPNQLRLQLQHQLPARMVLNLTSYMCWTDEDMIGRIARLSRRAHKKTTPMRTLERAKCLYVRQWARHFS